MPTEPNASMTGAGVAWLSCTAAAGDATRPLQPPVPEARAVSVPAALPGLQYSWWPAVPASHHVTNQQGHAITGRMIVASGGR